MIDISECDEITHLPNRAPQCSSQTNYLSLSPLSGGDASGDDDGEWPRSASFRLTASRGESAAPRSTIASPPAKPPGSKSVGSWLRQLNLPLCCSSAC